MRMRKLKYDKKGCHAQKGNCEITSGKKIRWVIITMTSMTTHIETLQCCIQNYLLLVVVLRLYFILKALFTQGSYYKGTQPPHTHVFCALHLDVISKCTRSHYSPSAS